MSSRSRPRRRPAWWSRGGKPRPGRAITGPEARCSPTEMMGTQASSPARPAGVSPAVGGACRRDARRPHRPEARVPVARRLCRPVLRHRRLAHRFSRRFSPVRQTSGCLRLDPERASALIGAGDPPSSSHGSAVPCLSPSIGRWSASGLQQSERRRSRARVGRWWAEVGGLRWQGWMWWGSESDLGAPAWDGIGRFPNQESSACGGRLGALAVRTGPRASTRFSVHSDPHPHPNPPTRS